MISAHKKANVSNNNSPAIGHMLANTIDTQLKIDSQSARILQCSNRNGRDLAIPAAKVRVVE